ncbi:bacterial proteasome activator family protein [Demetria terragena]|uniref:bacterial proteasome activator family protein n=1 Tax=Demetria terragena TaxID=63959 RepID=UPI0003795358|nr:bacterial proteasome activator family protein [Demetria terragena]
MSDDANQDSASPEQRIVVLTPDGMGVAPTDPDEDQRTPADQVEQPAKVMRIGSMIKQLLEEVRDAPLDEAGRKRLAEIHQRSIAELKDGISEDLIEELDRLALPFTDGTPSDAELRIAQAQLVGWLEGLFHGIQAAMVAQQMAAQTQLQAMQRGLPRGQSDTQAPGSATTGPQESGPTGQYL